MYALHKASCNLGIWRLALDVWSLKQPTQQLAIANIMQRQLHCVHVDCTTKCYKYKSTYVLPTPSCRVASAVYYKVAFRVVIREQWGPRNPCCPVETQTYCPDLNDATYKVYISSQSHYPVYTRCWNSLQTIHAPCLWQLECLQLLHYLLSCRPIPLKCSVLTIFSVFVFVSVSVSFR